MKSEPFARGVTSVVNSDRRAILLDGSDREICGGANDNWSGTSEQDSEQAAEPLGGRTKRIIDILIAAAAIVTALPVMVAVAAILKLSGNQVFFVHGRIGLNGRIFNCYKFRTMVDNPEGKLKKYLSENPDAAAEWHATQKLKHDPRVTFFGRMLRKSSMDELPQLFNVLRGEMSCVGPRPITAGELTRYGASVKQYLSCRPGITGLWQVNGRCKLSYEQRVALDTKYVDSWSLRSDLAILLRTIFAVIRFDETS